MKLSKKLLSLFLALSIALSFGVVACAQPSGGNPPAKDVVVGETADCIQYKTYRSKTAAQLYKSASAPKTEDNFTMKSDTVIKMNLPSGFGYIIMSGANKFTSKGISMESFTQMYDTSFSNGDIKSNYSSTKTTISIIDGFMFTNIENVYSNNTKPSVTKYKMPLLVELPPDALATMAGSFSGAVALPDVEKETFDDVIINVSKEDPNNIYFTVIVPSEQLNSSWNEIFELLKQENTGVNVWGKWSDAVLTFYINPDGTFNYATFVMNQTLSINGGMSYTEMTMTMSATDIGNTTISPIEDPDSYPTIG